MSGKLRGKLGITTNLPDGQRSPDAPLGESLRNTMISGSGRWALVALLGLPTAGCSGVKEHWPNGKPSFEDPATGGAGPASGGGSGGGGASTPAASGGSGGSMAGGSPSGGSMGGGTVGGSGGSIPPGNNGGATGGAGAGGQPTTPPMGNNGGAPGTTPPPPGEGIDIGGKSYGKDDVVVFIHIGHSNMGGRAQEPKEMFDHFIWYGKSLQPGGQPDPKFDPNPLPYDPRLWSFTLDGKFIPAREPLASDQSKDAGAGPGMGIMRAAAAMWPKTPMFVSIGRGQSGLRGGFCAHFLERNLVTNQPYSTTPPTSQEDDAGNRNYSFYTEVMTQRALKLKGKVKFGGIIALFGATEDRTGAAVPSPPAVPYLSQCLIKIASTYRAALGDNDIPFIISDFDHGSGDWDYNSPLGVKVRGQVRAAQMQIPRSDIISTEGVEMRDDHHFTMRGHKTWGDRAIELIDKNGWAPWGKK